MEFQLSCFKSWKMMLWKGCTQYARKFGKLTSGHRTGKGQFPFQSQKKAMPKNAQTTAQLYSSHMLAKLCSKFFKLGFSSGWTESFQMHKLHFEEAEERKKVKSLSRVWLFATPCTVACQVPLSRDFPKSFKLGFSSGWTENFQMYKLGFKEAEEPEIK